MQWKLVSSTFKWTSVLKFNSVIKSIWLWSLIYTQFNCIISSPYLLFCFSISLRHFFILNKLDLRNKLSFRSILNVIISVESTFYSDFKPLYIKNKQTVYIYNYTFSAAQDTSWMPASLLKKHAPCPAAFRP